ncbi:Major facilitator superfamily domain, general substrate transporter [Cordyceps fumosorosea ARSEF 2679]|uniref:Autophagy-related protein n=1 Tax=Cordyceps fumosorosea (strain ARSEF 2679) TaxID=1081104 RepID=A0A167SC76_CORFA|nr:Major facilitator superfamily domain, general substrate transporter [Cordyceps fumosorosea ARSEF 2679]OAA59477.1 Major facilitator superfamily domain, general substrate transporter [Cordyceps fumosorosea ARSEF 2679]
MAESNSTSPGNPDPIAGSDPQHVPAEEKRPAEEHIEDAPGGSDNGNGSVPNLHKKGALGFIQQQHTIPTTGGVMPTGKWEYIFFCIYYFSNNGAPIGGNGGALRQALTSQAFPDKIVHWGGQHLNLNSFLLDITGILFAAQLVTLLTVGPYADYGNWRPWIMIIAQSILYICQFAMCGINQPGQWQAAQALYVIGSLAANIATAFYTATFPSLVHNLPKVLKSEQDVRDGVKSPEEHAELDSYERSKLYNLCNITGSALVVVFYAIAVGISAGIGFDTPVKLIRSYNVLMGYFGALTVICTVPFFLVQKHRPGQQLPEGTSFWSVGFKQIWSAMKSAKELRQCLLYLLAFFMLQETFGTYFNITGILQNEVINYSPLKLNAMSLVADLSGGSGTVFVLLLQKKFRFSVKAGVFYGACMTLVPSLWGGIGLFTDKIGFKNVWEFWLAQAWNFQTAAWGSYQITMISEVVPAPKAFLFFALFNCVGKTSGFIGPFISSAIIERAHGRTNAAYWFLFAMGSVGCFALWFVDTDKAKRDNARYLEREAAEYYSTRQIQESQNEKAESTATA